MGENVGLEIQNIKEVVGGLVMVCLSIDGDSSKGNDAAKMMGATLLEISCKFVPAFPESEKQQLMSILLCLLS